MQETNMLFLTVQQNLKSSRLDIGLRLDGCACSGIVGSIVSVFGNASHISDRTVQFVNGKKQIS